MQKSTYEVLACSRLLQVFHQCLRSLDDQSTTRGSGSVWPPVPHFMKIQTVNSVKQIGFSSAWSGCHSVWSTAPLTWRLSHCIYWLLSGSGYLIDTYKGEQSQSFQNQLICVIICCPCLHYISFIKTWKQINIIRKFYLICLHLILWGFSMFCFHVCI